MIVSMSVKDVEAVELEPSQRYRPPLGPKWPVDRNLQVVISSAVGACARAVHRYFMASIAQSTRQAMRHVARADLALAG
jgi:hypothetical protein